MIQLVSIWLAGACIAFTAMRSERVSDYLMTHCPEIHLVMEALPNALGTKIGFLVIATYALAWPLWIPAGVSILAFVAIRRAIAR